jgi:hypothetical protein
MRVLVLLSVARWMQPAMQQPGKLSVWYSQKSLAR